MAGRFRRVRGHGARGQLSVTLGEAEVDVLRHLLGELLDLLGELAESEELAGLDAGDPLAQAVGIGTATAPPEDPALARLFPDGYTDDPEAAAEFRRYTESGLRERKRAAAAVTLATLDTGPGRIVLDSEQAQAWLGSLNDLRLALGERLDITEEHYGQDVADDDPRAYAFAIYDLLTYLQDTLVRALD